MDAALFRTLSGRTPTFASSSSSPCHDFLAFSKFRVACVNSFFRSRMTPSSKKSCRYQRVSWCPSQMRTAAVWCALAMAKIGMK